MMQWRNETNTEADDNGKLHTIHNRALHPNADSRTSEQNTRNNMRTLRSARNETQNANNPLGKHDEKGQTDIFTSGKVVL